MGLGGVEEGWQERQMKGGRRDGGGGRSDG